MKHLKIFENFEEDSEIDKICKNDFNIKNFIINDDKSVTAITDVTLSLLNNFNKLPFKFDKALGNFNCRHNYLSSLENSPNYVSGDFDCSHNYLATLIGGPKYVGGTYYCSNSKLKDVYGFPENYPQLLSIYNNPVVEILNLSSVNSRIFDSLSLIKFVHLLNEEKAIRNQNTVIQDRLEEALDGVGIKEFPENYEFKNYKLI